MKKYLLPFFLVLVAVSGVYAQSTFFDLVEDTAPDGADIIPCQQAGGGDTNKCTFSNASKALNPSNIPNTPAGGVAATDIQGAINELDTDKSSTGHTHTESDITDLDHEAVSLQGSPTLPGTCILRDIYVDTDATPAGQQVYVCSATNTWSLVGDGGGGGGGISAIVEDTTPQLGGQLDVNGSAIGDGSNELVTFVEDASAVNQVEVENEATGAGPIIRSTGDDTNVELNLDTKGTANVEVLDNLNVTGSITLSGTVDGRDLAADGTKLDGVEVAADVTDAANVNAAGAVMHTDISSNGIVARTASETYTPRSIAGTTDEIDAANGDGVSGNPTIGLADDPIVPGTGRIRVPVGTTAQRPGTPGDGDLRVNTTTGNYEGYRDSAWRDLEAGGGGGGDSVSIDSVAVTDPDFVSTGDIDFVDTSNTVTANLNADVVGADELADGDLGDVSVSGGVVSLDADVVAPAEMADADHGDLTWASGIATIDAGAVTAAKQENIAEDTIVGRVASGSGVRTALTASQVNEVIRTAFDNDKIFYVNQAETENAALRIYNTIQAAVDAAELLTLSENGQPAIVLIAPPTSAAWYDESVTVDDAIWLIAWGGDQPAQNINISSSISIRNQSDLSNPALQLNHANACAIGLYIDTIGAVANNYAVVDITAGNACLRNVQVASAAASTGTGVRLVQSSGSFSVLENVTLKPRASNSHVNVYSTSNLTIRRSQLFDNGAAGTKGVVNAGTGDVYIEYVKFGQGSGRNMTTCAENTSTGDLFFQNSGPITKSCVTAGSGTVTYLDEDTVATAGAVMADGAGDDITGDLTFDEKADHSETPAAGHGYLWVKNTAPSTLVFTDDAGTDTTLGSGGGSSTFTGLSDTPANYTDSGGKLLAVNAGGTAVEFIDNVASQTIGAWVPIGSEVELGSAGPLEAITIPSGYDRLMVIASLHSDRATVVGSSLKYEVNDDTTDTNYDHQKSAGSNGSAATTEGNTPEAGGTVADGATAGARSYHTIIIYNPDSTTDFKQITDDFTNWQQNGVMFTGRSSVTWRSASAMTKLEIQDFTDSDFKAGSKYQLYGWKHATIGSDLQISEWNCDDWTPNVNLSNITESGCFRLVGQQLEMRISLDFTGAPTPSATQLQIDMHPDYTIDSSVANLTSYEQMFGHGEARDSGTATYYLGVYYNNSASKFEPYTYDTAVSSTRLGVVTNSNPFGFVAGDQIEFFITVPVTAAQVNSKLLDYPPEKATVSTTDATVTTIATIAAANDQSYAVEALVIGRRTGGASGADDDAAAYKLLCLFTNDGTATAEIGEDVTTIGEDQAGWAADCAVSGDNALIRVTGAASNDVSWTAEYKVVNQ